MKDRPTPETDAARHDMTEYGSPVPCSWGDWVHVDVASKLERERDEAREHLEQIKDYGTEEINAAVELRQKLAQAMMQRDQWASMCARYKQERDDALQALTGWENKWKKDRENCKSIIEKAKELIVRWDQPSWKDTAPTARFINALRIAVKAYERET